MISRELIPTEVNYIEFTLFDSIIENGEDVFLTKLPKEETFLELLNNVKKVLGSKGSLKNFKQFVLNDLTYNVDTESSEITVIGLKPVSIIELGENYVAMGFEKKKLSIINFPSTTAYNDIVHVHRITYRISNRVFINFEQRTSSISREEIHSSYCIYINYNHDLNVDWEIVKKDFARVYGLLNLKISPS